MSKKVSKRELRRQQIAREKRMKQLRVWGPVGVLLVGILIVIGIRLFNQQNIEGVVLAATAPGGQHDTELVIPFGETPPMGGPHNPRWQNCGVYDSPVEPQFAIHSMEHGAIWITYQPDLPAAEIAALEERARGDEYILLSPYPNQESPVVMTVWDRQLELESSADERVNQFIQTYRRARGPERTASCQGGVGVPTG